MRDTDLPHLFAYLGGYWHQDFEINGETIEDVTNVFISDSTESTVRALVDELDRVLSGGSSDEELQRSIFDEGPGSITPSGFDYSARQWLEALRQHLAKALSSTAE